MSPDPNQPDRHDLLKARSVWLTRWLPIVIFVLVMMIGTLALFHASFGRIGFVYDGI